MPARRDQNCSPWLDGLAAIPDESARTHASDPDVAIVGGGIAGAATAYFVLHGTGLSVTLIEAGEVGSGATGHNAGQVVSYFEKGLTTLAQRHGTRRVAEAQSRIDAAWGLLRDMHASCRIQTPLDVFTGYTGLRSKRALVAALEEERFRAASGLVGRRLLVSGDAPSLRLPRDVNEYYDTLKQPDLLQLLGTQDPGFVGAIAEPRGVMNAAAFSRELVGYLQRRFSTRFALSQRTLVDVVSIGRRSVRLTTSRGLVKARHVVLCTNGFENVILRNEAGPSIGKRFRQSLYGAVGYMFALKVPECAPSATTFANRRQSRPYYYVTRRTISGPGARGLVCIGGPEVVIQDTRRYSRDDPSCGRAARQVAAFLRRSGIAPTATIGGMDYRWHGLMGYTRAGIRLIGREPRCRRLLYNLGCNGVGILPSLHGAESIARSLAVDSTEESLFQPT